MNIFDQVWRNFKNARSSDSSDPAARIPRGEDEARSSNSDANSEGEETGRSARPEDAQQEAPSAGDSGTEANGAGASGAGQVAGDSEGDYELLIKPLTLDAVEEMCKAEPDAVLETTEDSVILGVNRMRYQVSLSEHNMWLLIKTNLVIPAEQTPFANTNPSDPKEMDAQLHLMIEATNRWNNAHYQPTAYVSRDSRTWVVQLDTAYFVGEGMTPSQFYSSLTRALKYADQAASAIPGFIPPI